MKRKTEKNLLRASMWKYIVPMLALCLVVGLTTFVNYLIYNDYYNDKVIDIANQIVKDNPKVDRVELAKILKNPNKSEENVLEKYGYSRDELYLIGDIKHRVATCIGMNVFALLVIATVFALISQRKARKRQSEIEDIILCLEKINNGNYDIELDKYDESEFSKLRCTASKITALLKENAEYLYKERLILKDNIADISHQLRTPLTSTTLMIETLLDEAEMTEEKKNEYINKIYEKNEKIKYLVEMLLKLSRLETSVIEFKRKEVRLCDMLENVVDGVQSLAWANKVEILLKVDRDIMLHCDNRWQEEALTNIVKNCIDYSKENGVVKIEAEDNNFYTLVSIRDNGEGISSKDIAKIFDRFHKGEHSKGFGIGLNLAKTIIEKDNGMIDVSSKVGEGSVFRVKYIKT